MKIIAVPALKTSLRLGRGSEAMCLYTRELVRDYMETHLGCHKIEIERELKLNRRTVMAAVAAIRKEWRGK
jgi:hypothetical protein